MTIQDGELLLATDLESIWTPITSGISLNIDVYEEDAVQFSFTNVTNTVQEVIFIPPTDTDVIQAHSSTASVANTTTVTFTVNGNLNEELILPASVNAGAETNTDLSAYLPVGATGLLAGDIITITASGISGTTERADITLICKSKWTRF